MANKLELALTQEETELFVTLYRDQEFLWNSGSKEYMKAGRRSTGLRYIADQMGKGWNESHVKAKWKHLRTTYARELRKTTETQKSGTGSSDVYTSNWWLFSIIDGFLRPHTVARRGTTNLPEGESTASCLDDEVPGSRDDAERLISELENRDVQESPDPDHVIAEPQSGSPITQRKRPKTTKLKESATVDRCTQLMDTMQNRLDGKTRKCTDRNSDDTFGMLVADELKKIESDDVKDDFKCEVMNLLRDAKKKDRRQTSSNSLFSASNPIPPFETTSSSLQYLPSSSMNSTPLSTTSSLYTGTFMDRHRMSVPPATYPVRAPSPPIFYPPIFSHMERSSSVAIQQPSILDQTRYTQQGPLHIPNYQSFQTPSSIISPASDPALSPGFTYHPSLPIPGNIMSSAHTKFNA